MYLYLLLLTSIVLIILLNQFGKFLTLKFALNQYDDDFSNVLVQRFKLFSLFEKFIDDDAFADQIKSVAGFDDLSELEREINLLAESVFKYINHFDGHFKSGELLDLEQQVLVVENQYSTLKSHARTLEKLYLSYSNRFDYKFLSKYLIVLRLNKPFFVSESTREQL